MKKSRIFFLPAFLVIALFLSIVPSCSRIQTVTIGLITDLDGGNSHIGNEIFQNLKLFQRETNLFKLNILALSAPTVVSVPEQFQKLWDQGVRIFVIGHISAGIRELIEKKNPQDCLIFNLLSASQTFSGIDDCFIRMVPDTKAESLAIAEYIEANLHGKKILVIYETQNYPYTLPALAVLTNTIDNPCSVYGMNLAEFKTKEIGAALKKFDFDGVYLLIGGDYATQAGLLTHIIKGIRPGCKIILSPWLNTSAYLENSGSSSDGAVVPSLLPSGDTDTPFREFLNTFYRAFNVFPRVPQSYFAYEAMQILSGSIQAGKSAPQEIKSYILNSPGFDTILGKLTFDKFGDVHRVYRFLVIRNGKTVYEN